MPRGHRASPSRTRRYVWCIPASIALLIALGGVAGNLIAADIDSIRKDYLWAVWGVFGAATIVAAIMAAREYRQRETNHSSPDDHDTSAHPASPMPGLAPDQHLRFLTSQTLIGHHAEHTQLRTLYNRIIPEEW